MRDTNWLGWTIALLPLPLLAGCTTTRPIADLVIANVWVHDGRGGPPVRASVSVRNGLFTQVGARMRAHQSIDGTRLHLVPGLIDMHVHMAAVEGRTEPGAAFTSHGVTTVRDLGGFPAQVRQVVAADSPHVHSALQTLNGIAASPFHRVIASVDDARAAVADLAAAGAVVIKVHRAYKPALLAALMQAALAKGLGVTGHIPLGLHPLRACQIGMSGIEHVGSFIEAYVSNIPGATQQSAIDYMLSDRSAALYQCLASRRVTVTPTLILYRSIARARGGNFETRRTFDKFIAQMQAITLRLHRAGVVLLAGTDASGLDRPAVTPGVSLLDELDLLEEAGLGRGGALAAAGANAGKALGITAEGSLVKPGLAADFLLLPGNPLDSLSVLRRPVAIYVAGHSVRQPPTGGD